MLHVRVRRSLGVVAALCALEPWSVLAAPPSRVVTLITGDRVTVDAAGNAVVHAAPGRQSVPIQVQKIKGHTHVIPSDALAPLHAGQLDPRLFDVTELIASGYHNRSSIPVIVTGSAGAASGMPNTYASPAAPQPSVGRSLPVVEGVGLAAAADGSFWREWRTASASYAADGGGKLWLDGRRQLSSEENLKQIGADVAHEHGLRGDGVKVAVIDSGIDTTHRDLTGQVAAQKNFISDEEDDRDYVGHGTHVASVIAGTGAKSDGRFEGIAPHAKLIDAKACGQQGCTESALLEAMEWAAQQGARIINMSLGAQDSSQEDLVERAVNKLSKKYGVLFVVAAGNDFLFNLPVGSPASAEAALAVGALDSGELPTSFSQRGRLGELSIKPELVAPGVDITGALSHFIAQDTGELQARDDAPGYATGSGTSMAAPHVSGAAALLSQRHPDWKGDRLKAVLMGSAKLLDGQSALAQGAGLVDIPAALELQLHAEPAAVSFGTQSWPHDDDSVREQTVSLHNDTDNKVTLDLALEASGPDGASADGVFSLSDKQLTIDAHGAAEVTLTADTRKGTDGLNSGVLIASNDKISMHVPFAVDREVESYDLQLRFTGRDGKPAGRSETMVTVLSERSGGGDYYDVVVGNDGVAKARLPRGEYTVTATALGAIVGTEPESQTVFAYPRLTVEGDREVAFDAREAKAVTVEGPLAEAELHSLSFNYDTGHGGAGGTVSKEGKLFSLRLGDVPDSALGDVTSTVDAIWLPPGAPADSAYQFIYGKRLPGELPSGFEAHTQLADYIRVDAKFARGGVSVPANFTAMAIPAEPGASYAASGSGVEIALPSARRMYFIDDPSLAWLQSFSQFSTDASFFDDYSQEVKLEPGKRHHAQWNQAVFGPVASSSFGPTIQSRSGNTLALYPSLIGDSEGRSNTSGGSRNVAARLFREGELLKQSKTPNLFVEVPPGSSRYRVEYELKRPEPAELSTQVKLAWEFVSSETNTESAPLPVSYIRFQPELSQNSAAQQGATFELASRVEPQDPSVAEAESLTVDVSYDDGNTWTEADVTGNGQDWTAQLEHPQQSGYVSLRAAAVDADDNVVETTIIRAYRLE